MKKVLLVHDYENVATYNLGTTIKDCGHELTTMSLRSLQKSLDSVGETDLIGTFNAVILSGEIPCYQHKHWWRRNPDLHPVGPNPYLDVYQQLRDRYRLLVILHSTNTKLPVRDVKVSTESEIQKLLQSKLS